MVLTTLAWKHGRAREARLSCGRNAMPSVTRSSMKGGPDLGANAPSGHGTGSTDRERCGMDPGPAWRGVAIPESAWRSQCLPKRAGLTGKALPRGKQPAVVRHGTGGRTGPSAHRTPLAAAAPPFLPSRCLRPKSRIRNANFVQVLLTRPARRLASLLQTLGRLRPAANAPSDPQDRAGGCQPSVNGSLLTLKAGIDRGPPAPVRTGSFPGSRGPLSLESLFWRASGRSAAEKTRRADPPDVSNRL